MPDQTASALVLTLGDPAGIGPEITIKAWQALRQSCEHAFALIAPPELIEQIFNPLLKAAALPPVKPINSLDKAAQIFADHLPVLPLNISAPSKDIRIKPGRPNAQLAPYIIGSIDKAVELCLTGGARAVVTNPISKAVLYEAGFSHPGHTEYLGKLSENAPVPYSRGPLMMLTGGGLKVALVTIHTPLAQVSGALSVEEIVAKAQIVAGALKTDFGLPEPRIALCGLNPHAGEGGAIGLEETQIINPAAKILQRAGLNISDARAADTLFHAEARESYDAVLAMYHDQGLIPVKTLDFHGGVNATLGLPFIRTSPDHGTAYNIAGQGVARPDSLIAAIKLACNMANQRACAING